MGDFKARRYAVKFNPPRFILEYADDTGKTRTRSVRAPTRLSRRSGVHPDVPPSDPTVVPPRVPLTPPRPHDPPQIGVRIPEDPDPDAIVADVTRAFPRRLDRAGVRREQVLGLVRRMLDAARGAGSSSAAGFAENADLNVVSPEKLVEAKAAMDEGFNRNRKVHGDPGFVYDVQREFRPTRPNDWDDSDEDDDVAGLLPCVQTPPGTLYYTVDYP